MNTLVLNKNINFEEYQQIVDYFATIGIEVTNPYKYPSLITNEDREAIALGVKRINVTQTDKITVNQF